MRLTLTLKGQKLLNCGISLERTFLLRAWTPWRGSSTRKRNHFCAAYLSMCEGYVHAQICTVKPTYGPWFAIVSQKINRLGSVCERRICPVPLVHNSEGVVHIQRVAQTQGRQYLVYFLRFLPPC